MSEESTIDILFLKTSLFGDAMDQFNALRHADGVASNIIEIDPEQMGDADWDTVIQLSLQAKKVVTL